MTERKYTKRITHTFQLRHGAEYPIDAHVDEILRFKRSQKKEATAIRDGVRLLWSLENGELDVLFELFPLLKDRLDGNGAGGDDTTLQGIMERLDVIAAQKTLGYLMQPQQPVAPAPTSGKLLGGFKPLAAPVDDDDDAPMLAVKKNTSVNAVANFLNSMSQTQ